MNNFSKIFIFAAICSASTASLYSDNFNPNDPRNFPQNDPRNIQQGREVFQDQREIRTFNNQRNPNFQEQFRERGYNQSSPNSEPQGDRRLAPQNINQNRQNPNLNPNFQNAPINRGNIQQRDQLNRNLQGFNEEMPFNDMFLSQSNYSMNPEQGTSPGNLDNSIVDQIRQKIQQDNYLSEGAKNIQVSSEDGYVGLRGFVHSNEEKNRLESISKNISGVKKVSSNLEIK